MAKEPKYEEQLDEYGNPEKVDVSEYSHIITCMIEGCTQIRHVKPQDVKQVTMCKPHIRRIRLNKRNMATKMKRAGGDPEIMKTLRNKLAGK